ncbi:MAG: ABC transporter ATP-binding protein [Deltaproteobacteria bacterium]|nr:ABC transporter ATP-binding protein [Deltaproteobacteria bacterium]
MAVLEVKNLTKDFDGIKAVNNMSFGIENNSITALIGPNGSGKTTVFNLITGFLKPEGGKVCFNDKEITSLNPYKIAKLGIARTFQNIRLFPQMSVLDNVMLALKYRKGDRFVSALFQTKIMKAEERENQEKAETLLNLMGLINKRNVFAETLSHGQRKLLEIAKALALDPQILLLDEPTAGLFPEMKSHLLGIIKHLKKEGKTVLFIEHDINVVMGIAEKIIVLDYGKKISEGNTNEVSKDQNVQEVYLGIKK